MEGVTSRESVGGLRKGATAHKNATNAWEGLSKALT
jgi:hypothetical protein